MKESLQTELLSHCKIDRRYKHEKKRLHTVGPVPVRMLEDAADYMDVVDFENDKLKAVLRDWLEINGTLAEKERVLALREATRELLQ